MPDPKADRSVTPIGGFFSLAMDDVPPVPGSIWQEWVRHYGAVATFGTGRAALAALIEATLPRRVWLPAYYCPEVTGAVSVAAAKIMAEVLTYPLTDALAPDPAVLEAQLVAGDVVVVVDYFGWPPHPTFRDWVRGKPEVIWVEDRAQALWTADPPWASWCIFSARKLLGVPNGGILLGTRLPAARVASYPPADLTVALPELMRFEDRQEIHNDRWYAAYKDRENGFIDNPGAMSRLTESLLHRIPLEPLVSARQENYRYLLERLPSLAAWPREADNVAPFGLPIAVENAQLLGRQLAAERLFCARHWPEISADPARFPYEHSLSRHLLTLPCDHRYHPEQLARLVDTVERLAPPPGCIRKNRGTKMTYPDGPIVLCFGIVDEADIITDFLDYHLSLGIEYFIATDVGSTDGTLDILSAYERSGRLHLTRLADPSVRVEQRDWLSVMAVRARETYNAAWCLFCDPDEFWVFPTPDAPIYLKAAPSPVVIFPRYNMLPAAGTREAAHYRTFDLVVRHPLEFLYDLTRLNTAAGVAESLICHPPDILRFIGPKVLARADVIRAVKPGFHDVETIDPALSRHRESQGYIGHFQIRSAARYCNKARLVADYIAANPPEADRYASRHWVRLAALYRHGLVEAEYARQLLGKDEIAARLAEGVIERDGRIAARLARIREGGEFKRPR
jgi:hypothetical protein